MDRMTLIMGDVHGKWGRLKTILKGIFDADIFIAGDIGLGFHHLKQDESDLRKICLTCCQQNIMLYLVRGNHDNPSRWDEIESLTNVILVQDYETVHVNGKSILCIGGGVSIDRDYRTPGKDWWYNEKVIYNEEVEAMSGINYVITHVKPDFVPMEGELIYDDTIEEGNIMAKVFRVLSQSNKIKAWYFGHYHKRIFHEERGTNFFGIPELEIRQVGQK